MRKFLPQTLATALASTICLLFPPAAANDAVFPESIRLDQYTHQQCAALEFAKFIREVSNSAKHPANELLDEAVGLERDGRYDPALAAYQELLDKYSSGTAHVEALKRSARLYAKLAQYPMARKRIREFLASYPTSTHQPEALAELAWLENRLGNRQVAATVFLKLHKEFPQSAQAPNATYWLALKATDEKDSELANLYVDQLLEKLADRTDIRLRKLRGQALCLKCQLAASADHWETIRELSGESCDRLLDEPTRATLAFWLAEAEFRLGNYDKARSEFELLKPQTAGLTEPWVAMVPLRRAQLAARRQQWKEVLCQLDELEQRYPNFELNYEVDYLRGRALGERGKMTAAREAYHRVLTNQAAENSETSALALWMIAETYFHQHDYAHAKEIYLQVIKQQPQPKWQARAALQAGKCWELEGRWEKAKSLYSAALQQRSGSESEKQLQARLKWATTQTTKRR